MCLQLMNQDDCSVGACCARMKLQEHNVARDINVRCMYYSSVFTVCKMFSLILESDVY